MPDLVRIAVVGDVHLCWDDRDVRFFDSAGYDLILFVGDLAGYRVAGGLEVARSIARLRTRALVMPGNHDAVTLPQLASEVFQVSNGVRDGLASGMARRVEALSSALGPSPLTGYSLHRFEDLSLTVLAARPHSLGGPRLAFRRYLTERFGVRTMEDSAARLRALFDEVGEEERVLLLAHSGPTGLGAARSDIFGCDFRKEEGDFGDPDLGEALDYARRTRKKVIGVVAGHMHHRLRGGGQRRWQVVRDGIPYVNAARVPRRRLGGAEHQGHHVRLSLSDEEIAVEEVWARLA